jgi:Fe-S-cluster containining protein
MAGRPLGYGFGSWAHEGGPRAGPSFMTVVDSPNDSGAICQACGACCSFSAEWPRFSLETEADLERIPLMFVDEARGRMKCHGARCAALIGEVGVSTSCSVYASRPRVCRDCEVGDDACQLARKRFNL